MTNLRTVRILGLGCILFPIVTLTAYFWEITAALFLFGAPWSGVVAILMPLLGHMFGGSAWETGLLLTATVNFLILIRAYIVRRVNFLSEIDE